MDEALQLSKSPEAPITEVGVVIVQFLFTLAVRLAEAVYEDWVSNRGSVHSQMVGGLGVAVAGHEEKLEVAMEQVRKQNSLAAVHLMAKLMENKRTAGLSSHRPPQLVRNAPIPSSSQLTSLCSPPTRFGSQPSKFEPLELSIEIP